MADQEPDMLDISEEDRVRITALMAESGHLKIRVDELAHLGAEIISECHRVQRAVLMSRQLIDRQRRTRTAARWP